MVISSKLNKLLHRKSWELCTSVPSSTAAGVSVVGDIDANIPNNDAVYFFNSASTIYNYNADEDAYLTIPASGAAGTFGAGAAAVVHPLSAPAGVPSNTASAGTTTTITTALTITRCLCGCMIRVTGGAQIGYCGIIKSNTFGANSIITVHEAAGGAFSATTVFQIYAGSVWFFNPSSSAPGFRAYDRATNAWSSARSVTNVATNYATDGAMAATPSISGKKYLGLATAGTTNTLTDSAKAWVSDELKYCEIMITDGTGVGQSRIISGNTGSVITVYDNWSITPDITTKYNVVLHEQGIASSGGATTITDSSKSAVWTASQWINYQVRIIRGTGIGQIRIITANTTTALTVAAWATQPDNTSIYSIEGDNDTIFMTGDAVVALYKYTISANSWSVPSPGAARSGNTGAGLSLNWIMNVDNVDWLKQGAPAKQRQNGRYLYSFRGGATATLDIYDIAANTWISTWAYGNSNDTFSTGSSWCDCDGVIYGQKDATGRIYKFDVATNTLQPLSINPVPGSTAVAGKKILVETFVDQYNNVAKWIYLWTQSASNFYRMRLI
jgi:hypothetical protein